MSLTHILNNPEIRENFLKNLADTREKKIQALTARYYEQLLAITDISLHEGISENNLRKEIEKNYLSELAKIREEYNQSLIKFSQSLEILHHYE